MNRHRSRKTGIPRHKGKVERGVDYVQENALRGREFESLAKQNDHLKRWEETVADTRIHGTTRKQVRGAFETIERPALAKLPLERFPFYHEVRRKVSRDGHLSVNRACYSAPSEFLGREVWIRYDSRLLRIFDDQLRHVATHAVIEPGKFRTDPSHIRAEKISPIERGISYLFGKMRLIGPSSARWGEAVIEGRGVEASRVLQGVIAMSRKHSSDAIASACETALRSGAINCRIFDNF